jgi:hypothetical protein
MKNMSNLIKTTIENYFILLIHKWILDILYFLINMKLFLIKILKIFIFSVSKKIFFLHKY